MWIIFGEGSVIRWCAFSLLVCQYPWRPKYFHAISVQKSSKHSQNSDFSKRSVRTPFSVRILKAQLKILVREGSRRGWIEVTF